MPYTPAITVYLVLVPRPCLVISSKQWFFSTLASIICAKVFRNPIASLPDPSDLDLLHYTQLLSAVS